MKKKTGIEVWSTYHGRTQEPTWSAVIWRQPFWRWLYAEVYDWYSWHVHKIPGFMLVAHWHERLFNRKREWHFEPLDIRIELKAYVLREREREVLGSVEIPRELAAKLSKYVEEMPPRDPGRVDSAE